MNGVEDFVGAISRRSTPARRRRVCLVSCSAQKLRHSAEARELYSSPLFRSSRRWAESQCDEWFILSAKHSLVEPTEVIAPYDLALSELGARQRAEWSDRLIENLAAVLRPSDYVVMLSGITYAQGLLPRLSEMGNPTITPLRGMSIGRRVRWLKAQPLSQRGPFELEAFYYWLLARLSATVGGPRVLGEKSVRTWPEKGVYFILDPGETRSVQSSPRVCRVGTHAVSTGSTASLWNRLRTHRGVESGGGNHRSSIFRTHVGIALMARADLRDSFPDWGNQTIRDAAVVQREAQMERSISEYIGQTSVLWLEVPDAAGPTSDRSYIERNSIALLAQIGRRVDPPGASWLGFHSDRSAIPRSGLWNVNHVDEPWDPLFIEVLGHYVEAMEGRVALGDGPIAPADWWTKGTAINKDQLQFDWS